MTELTDLQEELMRIIKEFSNKDFFGASCELTNDQLYKAMRIRPNHVNYISAILADLKRKKKVKTVRKQIMGKGLKRIITIL